MQGRGDKDTDHLRGARDRGGAERRDGGVGGSQAVREGGRSQLASRGRPHPLSG